jgi:hypothetical protein
LKSVTIVSSSQQIQNYNLFAVTSSANTFYGNLTVDKSSPTLQLNAPTGTSGEYRLSNSVGTTHWSIYSTTGGGNSQGNWALYSAGRTGGAGSVIDITPAGATTFSSSIGTTALNMNNMASLGSIGGGAIYLPYTAGLFFRTLNGATARGKIQADDSNNLLLNSDNAGLVAIGTTSVTTKLHLANGDFQIQNANQTTGDFSQAQSLVFSQESSAYGAGITGIREAWSSMPFALAFFTNSVASGYTEKMRINSVGSVGAGGSSTNIYNASDIRLKKNISTITYGLDAVSALNPVKFNWADGFEPVEADKTLLGFIAQEVEEVIPEAIESFGGSIDLNGTTIENTLRVNEKFLIPVLTKAIQEQQAIIDSLIARIEALENN